MAAEPLAVDRGLTLPGRTDPAKILDALAEAMKDRARRAGYSIDAGGRGDSVRPLTTEERVNIYTGCNGVDMLTPAQRRRAIKKHRKAAGHGNQTEHPS